MKPASGALNTAARPAPAPLATSRCCRRDRADGSPSLTACAAHAPICTVGPSRPSENPAPMPSAPPTNFTGKSAFHGMSRSPRSTASMCGMPLPGASGANRTVSQPMSIRPRGRSRAARPIPSPGAVRGREHREPRPVDGVDGVAEQHGETAGEQADEGGAGEVGRRAVSSLCALGVRR